MTGVQDDLVNGELLAETMIRQYGMSKTVRLFEYTRLFEIDI